MNVLTPDLSISGDSARGWRPDYLPLIRRAHGSWPGGNERRHGWAYPGSEPQHDGGDSGTADHQDNQDLGRVALT